MDEIVVCLECGKRIGRIDAGACSCPPPSRPPGSRGPVSSAPYREAPFAPSCPRCSGRLREGTVIDARILDCDECGGVFVSRSIVEALDTPQGRYLRVAFPVRPRAAEPAVVRYLACPVCDNRMNRTAFARGANVIVDVCKEDGIWFDAGEVHAVIDFVEDGGLERAKRRAAQDRAAENERLRAAWRKVHDESVRETAFGRGHVHVSPEERVLAEAFFSWLWR
jgi:Zn-finger nucleic acid-binding protein